MIAASLARMAVRYRVVTLTILLFLLNLPRAGKQAGRLSERIETRERNDAIHSKVLEAASPVLLIGMLWRNGCARVGSEAGAPCPPVADYSTIDQAFAADEAEALAEDAVIVRMLTDHTVLRDRVRACG